MVFYFTEITAWGTPHNRALECSVIDGRVGGGGGTGI
jgi:hypothetical protein